MSKVVKHVLLKYIVPVLNKNVDKFAKEVVDSPKNSVNLIDINDVTEIAKNHFVEQLMSDFDEF